MKINKLTILSYLYVVLYSFIVLIYQRLHKANMLTARLDLDWAKAMSNKVMINEGLGLDRSCLWTQSNRFTRTTDITARLDLGRLKVVVKIYLDKASKVIARFDLGRSCQVKSKSKTIMVRSKSSWIKQDHG